MQARSLRPRASRRLRPSEVAFIQAEMLRLAAMTPDEFEWEGVRWRWGLAGEARSRLFRRFARLARRAGCQRLSELSEGVLDLVARRINWL